MTNTAVPLPLAVPPRDAAKMLSVSERTLWGLTQPRGPIHAVKIGRLVRYPIESLRGYLDQQGGTGQ